MTSLLETIDARIAECEARARHSLQVNEPERAGRFKARVYELEDLRDKVVEIVKELDRHTVEAPTPFGYVLKRDIDRIIGSG